MQNNMFEKEYFVNSNISSYENYSNCKGVLEELAKMVNEFFYPSSVFDSSCAYGFLVDWFNLKGIKSRGSDISNWATQFSKNIYQCDIRNLKEKDNSYEVVLSSETLEHIPAEDIDECVTELCRISNKYVVILVGMWEYPPENNVDPGDITHITFYSRKQWEQIIKKLGYERDLEKEKLLNENYYSVQMNWNNRFLVIKKD